MGGEGWLPGDVQCGKTVVLCLLNAVFTHFWIKSDNNVIGTCSKMDLVCKSVEISKINHFDASSDWAPLRSNSFCGGGSQVCSYKLKTHFEDSAYCTGNLINIQWIKNTKICTFGYGTDNLICIEWICIHYTNTLSCIPTHKIWHKKWSFIALSCHSKADRDYVASRDFPFGNRENDEGKWDVWPEDNKENGMSDLRRCRRLLVWIKAFSETKVRLSWCVCVCVCVCVCE